MTARLVLISAGGILLGTTALLSLAYTGASGSSPVPEASALGEVLVGQGAPRPTATTEPAHDKPPASATTEEPPSKADQHTSVGAGGSISAGLPPTPARATPTAVATRPPLAPELVPAKRSEPPTPTATMEPTRPTELPAATPEPPRATQPAPTQTERPTPTLSSAPAAAPSVKPAATAVATPDTVEIAPAGKVQPVLPGTLPGLTAN